MENKTNTTENVAVMNTGKDLMASVLIVSVLLNLAIFITWLAVSIDPSVSVAVFTH